MTGGIPAIDNGCEIRHRFKERAMEIINSSQIQSIQHVQGLHRAPTEKSNTEAVPASTVSLKDSVSFSEEALRLSELVPTNTEAPRIRFDLVNRIKAEIATGTYDTPEKMDIAIERMASRIF